MKETKNCRLIRKKEIADGIFDFVIESESISSEAQCGQFLHINCGEGTFLRRPISICDAGNGEVRFIFEVKGNGTAELAKKEVGDYIDVMGPLGHGFEIKDSVKNPVIIGGGIGVFPLYKLAKTIKNADVFLGFRSKSRVVMEEEFEKVSNTVIVGTDDGSYGYNGYIASAMEQYLSFHKCDMIYCCGPKPMLKAVKKIAEDRGILCQLSLEQRMGCGIGACLVCVCETNNEGMDKYKRVCRNGPVFYSTEVTLND
ncbi:MAG: dihydroorotate dehydrogenase electron transfer subunit [Oscillospiraceae bacterium]|nr:dihydroorotate dehydrogenase electron transfer subunit [Oscillospiraceae bacterium]